jgi:Ca2+-binding EF-hand superfamily protein
LCSCFFTLVSFTPYSFSLQRIVRIFEAVNFKEFVRLLSAFSSRAERDDRITFLFTVYDIDGDGELM